MEKVILVDEKDRKIGEEEKMKAHENAKLHRAFSVFIFSPEGKMLLQRRARSKYHSGGLWTNTCCSHPKPNEDIEKAAHRRLKEEMSFDTELKEIFSFIYKAKFDSGLIEHEFDHVFFGTYEGIVKPDKKEVEEYKWMGIENLKKDVKKNPENYTLWFKIALERVLKFMVSKK